jgi:hypothetical protein
MFDPVGAFDVNASLLQGAVDAAKAIRASFPEIPPGLLKRLYGHWAVEPFGCTDGAYNAEVDFENGIWVMKITHDFRDNMAGLNDNPEASHTWERNTGALGIAISGMDGATTTNFGPDGVQLHELEHFCALVGVIAAHYDVDLGGKVIAPGETHPSSNDSGNVPGPINTTGENIFETHATCAMYDDYRSERWDFGSLHAMPAGVALSDDMRIASAAALRTRSRNYKLSFA